MSGDGTYRWRYPRDPSVTLELHRLHRAPAREPVVSIRSAWSTLGREVALTMDEAAWLHGALEDLFAHAAEHSTVAGTVAA